ncbi:hypothetical protein QTJ16_007134 [Diplocarpon rosae]|uniref:Uncharacterized protein n=1 Tax=Diplocarpon rosae TaxID=946125 RepID=A0AAD9W9X3_9HELO|nr:hypothetical protein QTJ16_007134 [Diplocarpon rosae]
MHRFGVLGARQDGGEGQPGGEPGTSTSTSPGAALTASSTSSSTAAPTTASATATPFRTGSGGNVGMVIPVVAAITGLFGLILGFFILRRTRIKHKNPKYLPTPFLKKAWQKWNPGVMAYKLPDADESLEPISRLNDNTAAAVATETEAATAGVGRNTSVRSVMTLPAYRPNALTDEQVLGREGDREGIDVVIEFPEGPDEEESRREEEMEALYQVRLARRRENEDRELRRRERREARDRGDFAALREIAARSRAASGASVEQTVEHLRAEHERIKRERQKPVSSVAYGDLGVARHDGTRIRASSHEDEQQGLLGDMASIATSSHYRGGDRRTSSILSIDTTNFEPLSSRLTRSRTNSRASALTEWRTSMGAGSSPENERGEVPPSSPPEYENTSLGTPRDERGRERPEPPPDYTSPVLARGEQPSLESTLPTHSPHASPSTVSRPTTPESPLSPHHRARAESVGVSADSRSSSRVSPARRGDGAGGRESSSGSSSQGVSGVPQLPDLRFSVLPSIHVDPESLSNGPRGGGTGETSG